MVATIRRIDTAFTTIRSFVTHNATPAGARVKAAGARRQQYDMMNVSQVSQVMSSLNESAKLAKSQADESMLQYRTRQTSVPQVQQETAAAAAAAPLQNSTQRRLEWLQHSSVSQNISALLSFSSTPASSSAASRAERMQIFRRDAGNLEVGVKELARVGAFGGDKARRYELSL